MHLKYYRSWCQWNYLRLNEIGENVISQLSQIFPETDYKRVYSLVVIFEKIIDSVNAEISKIPK